MSLQSAAVVTVTVGRSFDCACCDSDWAIGGGGGGGVVNLVGGFLLNSIQLFRLSYPILFYPILYLDARGRGREERSTHRRPQELRMACWGSPWVILRSSPIP